MLYLHNVKYNLHKVSKTRLGDSILQIPRSLARSRHTHHSKLIDTSPNSSVFSKKSLPCLSYTWIFIQVEFVFDLSSLGIPDRSFFREAMYVFPKQPHVNPA